MSPSESSSSDLRPSVPALLSPSCLCPSPSVLQYTPSSCTVYSPCTATSHVNPVEPDRSPENSSCEVCEEKILIYTKGFSLPPSLSLFLPPSLLPPSPHPLLTLPAFLNSVQLPWKLPEHFSVAAFFHPLMLFLTWERCRLSERDGEQIISSFIRE